MKLNYFILALVLTLTKQAFSQTDIRKLGAVGNGEFDNTKIIQGVVDSLTALGGGEVVFPEGVFLSGTVFLKSNISIHLTEKTIWKGIADTTAYKDVKEEHRFESNRAFIYAKNQKNIKIYGKGIIDGNGGAHAQFIPVPGKKRRNRPYALYFWGCKNITIQDITIQNPAFWSQRYFECDNLTIQGVKVFAHANLNNDGLDIVDCHGVRVTNCEIDSEDDALCFKSESNYGLEDVVVRNCILSSHASAIKLGTASFGHMKNIDIGDIQILPSKEKETLHFLQMPNGIAGIDLASVDGAIISDVSIHNIEMDGVTTPIFIRLGTRNRFWRPESEGNRAQTRVGSFQNTSLQNITAINAGRISSSITGTSEAYISDIHLSNINISFNESLEQASGWEADVPQIPSNYPVSVMFDTPLPSYGFYVRYAKDIVFEHVNFISDSNELRPAIIGENVRQISLHKVTEENKHGIKSSTKLNIKKP